MFPKQANKTDEGVIAASASSSYFVEFAFFLGEKWHS
jgi:hypothetical protein